MRCAIVSSVGINPTPIRDQYLISVLSPTLILGQHLRFVLSPKAIPNDMVENTRYLGESDILTIISSTLGGNDTKPSEYLTNIALSNAERDKIEGEITIGELEYSLFKKMKGSSAPGIDGFTVNWLRKFWSSLKLITFNAINECYRDRSLTSSLKLVSYVY